MAVLDGTPIGSVAGMLARVRERRARRDAAISSSALMGRLHEEGLSRLGIGAEDNVLLLGAGDLRPAARLAPQCRALTVLDDLPEARMTALGSDPLLAGRNNVMLRHWRSGGIPVPQGTIDRILSLGFLYRCGDPGAIAVELVWASHHACSLALCEPSASLDDRTARKYSREADLSMEDHAALLAYTRSATALRRFSREGLASLLARAGMKGVEVGEALHGLVLIATAHVEF